ncbi:SGF29 tudor-like domain-domain-containing protein [Syncephalastrum racemosum]|uniref:SGF29 tudor-like domain-domain-containing protein n=1 Tax=Syncephalastrum racemosum TaxID=13706 RepID=A0A1X2HIV4_SYNRA|nr:SGF29 tudor-like domain-domain-containing protein [Syncephalastrum racemosum]
MADRKAPRSSRSTATLEESSEEHSLWKQICTSLADLEDTQERSALVLEKINAITRSTDFNRGISASLKQQLGTLYQEAIELADKETLLNLDTREKISVLLALREASESDPRRKRKRLDDTINHQTTRKKNKTSSGTLLPGTSVAARQPNQKGKSEEWILAVVLGFQPDKNKYFVEDVDQDETGKKQQVSLYFGRRNIIPIPDRKDEAIATNHSDFPVGQKVLALYPGTTCFYRATVIVPPIKNEDINFSTHYRVRFDDDNDDAKYVMPEHVLRI